MSSTHQGTFLQSKPQFYSSRGSLSAVPGLPFCSLPSFWCAEPDKSDSLVEAPGLLAAGGRCAHTLCSRSSLFHTDFSLMISKFFFCTPLLSCSRVWPGFQPSVHGRSLLEAHRPCTALCTAPWEFLVSWGEDFGTSEWLWEARCDTFPIACVAGRNPSTLYISPLYIFIYFYISHLACCCSKGSPPAFKLQFLNEFWRDSEEGNLFKGKAGVHWA